MEGIQRGSGGDPEGVRRGDLEGAGTGLERGQRRVKRGQKGLGRGGLERTGGGTSHVERGGRGELEGSQRGSGRVSESSPSPA